MQVRGAGKQHRQQECGADALGIQTENGPPSIKFPNSNTERRASASKAARLEPCRCVALMRSSADSSADTSAHASVGRSSGAGGPSSGGRKSTLRCSAASVRSAWCRAHFQSTVAVSHAQQRAAALA